MIGNDDSNRCWKNGSNQAGVEVVVEDGVKRQEVDAMSGDHIAGAERMFQMLVRIIALLGLACAWPATEVAAQEEERGGAQALDLSG